MVFFCMITALLAGCGGGSGKEDTSSTTSINQFVYQEDMIYLDLEDTLLSDIIYKDNYIYVQAQVGSQDASIMPRMVTTQLETTEEVENAETSEPEPQDEATAEDGLATPDDESMPYPELSQDTTYLIGKFNLDGTKITSFETTLESGHYLNRMVVGGENQYFIQITKYATYEDEETSTDQQLIRSYNENGELLFELDVKAKTEGTYFYINNMVCLQDQLLVAGNDRLMFYSFQGELQEEIDLDAEMSGDVLISKNEDIYLRIWQEDGVILKKIDKASKSMGEALLLPFSGYQYSFFQGVDQDYLLTDGIGVYGYNVGDEALTPIINYIDSDMNTNGITYIKAIDEKSFFAYYYSDDFEQIIAKLTKVNPEDVVKKEVFTLGAWYLDWDVKKQVISYNKTSTTHRIKIIDYSTYNTQDDYTAGLTKLNTDIIAGNMPDIMLLHSNMPVKSYMAKGLFADFYELMEQDDTINRSDYLENVFEATSYNGKLYQLIPYFYIYTVVGKTSEVGPNPGWTLDDLKALVATKDDSVEIFSETIRSDLLYYFLSVNNTQFIDWETGQCSFDTKEFQDILEFVKQFPADFNYDIYYDNDDFWKNYESRFRTGSSMLKITSMTEFREYNRLKKGEFGEDITLVGFPTTKGNGSAFSYGLSFAISARTKNKEGAWEFVRYFMGDEYQATNTYAWPIKISQLDANAKEAMKKQSYTDENGKEIFYDQTYYIDGVEIILEEITQEEVDTVKAFIQSINQVMTEDTNLNNIITEEAESYFSGQKSVTEVSNIIQSRAQIYVNENR